MSFAFPIFRKSAYSLILLFFQVLSLQAHAQQEPEKCPLPPPAKLWVTAVTSTSISVQWSEVPNAQMYEVEVFEQASGNPVALLHTPELQATVGGLTPGTWYRINVRASACEDGPFGDPQKTEGQTSIIIVDVIIQRECPFSGKRTNWPTNTKLFSLTMNSTAVYRIKLSDPNYGAELDISTEALSNELAIQENQRSGCFMVATDSVLEVHYNTPPPGAPLLMRLEIANSLAPQLSFEVEKSPSASVTEAFCSGNPPRPRSDFGATDLKVADVRVAPNPVFDEVTVYWNAETGQTARCLLSDASGRVWKSLTANAPGFKISTADLAPGLYFLRLESQGFKAVKILVKSL